MDKNVQTEIEAAVFRRLVSHLQQHTDVQNIDLMILADFCRNCLAKWYTAAAIEQGMEMDYEQAREVVAAYAPWIRMDPCAQREGWTLLAGRRTQT